MISPKPTWSKGPEVPALVAGEVHLWRAPLSEPTLVAVCQRVLSPQEMARAAKFAFERDRNHYVISHGAVRMVLARYSGIAAEDLEFETGENGKPRLVQRFTDLRYNLSHTDGLALIAVTRSREVGVDVERVDRQIAFETIAEHYFTPRELWDLRIAPAAERASRFFEAWTRNEARLKASGEGLGGLGRVASGETEVRNLCPGEGYAGAVACAGSDWRLAYWDWSV